MEEMGSIFLSIGVMFCFCMVALLLYQIVRMIKPVVDKEWKYELLEENVLDRVALKRGIDLKKAGIERNILNSKSFRKKVQEEMIKDMFGKEKGE